LPKSRHINLDRPIFIVGPGRSGTTIFYYLLCGHQDLGWFYESWLSRRINNLSLRSFFACLNVVYQIGPISRKYRKRAWFPKPSEVYELWDAFHPVENGAASPPFIEEHAASANAALMSSVMRRHLLYSGTSRFINKNTRNSRRMRYLHTLFPDALFIHIIRDGRGVTNSLLNVRFWPSMSLWWYHGRTPAELERQGENPVLLAARHWKTGMERVLGDKKVVPKPQYLEIRYENLMARPKATMEKVLDFCDLPWTIQFENHLNSFELKSKNYK
jgi:hypothetical protein